MISKIISASRREDMPAFRYEELVRRYSETGPETHFVLWTKNPARLLDARLDLARTSLQATITTLGGSEVEPGVPLWREVAATVIELIGRGLSPELVNWRLDPYIPGLADMEDIEELAATLAAAGVNRCTTSFISWYQKVQQRWPDGFHRFAYSHQDERAHADQLKKLLAGHKIFLYGCAQPHLAGVVIPARCIDGEHISRITGQLFDDGKDQFQRQHCGCTPSVDIGRHRVCPHGCLYCYSTGQAEDGSQAGPSEGEQLSLFD